MPTSADPDPRHERARADIPSLALGEPTDREVIEHIAHCDECSSDLAAYRHVVELARAGAGAAEADGPSPAVWEAIAAAVATPPPAGRPAAPPAAAPVVELRPRHRVRRALLAAAAVVAVAGAGVGGWAIGHDSGSGAGPAARAALQAQPGTKDQAHGIAAVRSSAAGYQLNVQTYDLPARDGYYEVWLFDPSANRMVAVGTLGTGGRGTFTVPGGMDLSAYHVVDVSAQRYNGNPAHDRSVLRGALRS